MFVNNAFYRNHIGKAKRVETFSPFKQQTMIFQISLGNQSPEKEVHQQSANAAYSCTFSYFCSTVVFHLKIADSLVDCLSVRQRSYNQYDSEVKRAQTSTPHQTDEAMPINSLCIVKLWVSKVTLYRSVATNLVSHWGMLK